MLKLFKILGYGVIGLLALIGLLIGALHFSAIGDQVGALVSDATGGEVELEGLRLSGGLNVRIAHARYQPRGAAEPMVEAQELFLDWSPMALLSGTARIAELRVGRLRYADVETPPSPDQDPQASSAGLPQLPVSVDLQCLEIGALELAAPSLGLESRYSLSGRAQIDGKLREASAALNGARQDADGRLAVSVDYGADRDRIAFSILFEDEDGAPLAAFTGFDGGALSLSLEGEGPLQETSQNFAFEMAKGPKAQGSWVLRYDEALGIAGALTVEPRGFGGADVAAYAGEVIALGFDASLEDQDLAATLTLPIEAQKLSAQIRAQVSGALDDGLDFELVLAGLESADVPDGFGPLAAKFVGRFDMAKSIVTLKPSQIATANRLTLLMSGDVGLNGPVDLSLKADAAALEALAPGVFGQAKLTSRVRADQLGLPARLTVNGEAQVATQEGGSVSPVDLKLRADISEAMAVDAELDLGVARLDGIAPDVDGSIVSKLTVKGSAENASGVLHARARSKGEALTLKAPFGYDGAALSLADLQIDGLGVEAQGGGRFVLDSGQPSGALDLAIADMGALAKLAGMEAQGRVNLTARLGNDGAMAGEVHIYDLALPAEGVAVKTFAAKITPQGETLGFAVAADAQGPVAAKLDMKGEAVLADAITVRLDALEGIVNDIPLTLLAPLRFTQDGEAMALAGLKLGVAGGTVEGGAALGAETIKADIKLIGLTPPDTYTGGVDLPLFARLQADGTRANPVLRLNAQTRIDHDGLDEAVTLSLKAGYRENAAKALLGLEGAGSSFSGTVDAPLTLDLATMAFGLTKPARVKADGKIALAAFEPFLLGDGSRFNGHVTLKADGEGDQSAWAADAALCLVEAGVDLAATGTVVEQLKGCVSRQRDGIVSGAITARDADKGTIKAEFDGSLLGEGPDALTAAIALKRFRLMDSDLGIVEASSDLKLDAQLADGLAGSLTGNVTIDRGDLIIPGNPGPGFETIEVRHVGRPGDAETVEDKAMGAPFGEDFALDMVLSVPANFFVRGRGLETEWIGGLDITGSAAAPQIDGTIELKKGSANAGVTTLELTKGEIRLFTPKPGTAPVVLVRLESESSVEGTTARMVVEGPVEDPEVSFSSTPELPQDEILARLIFGKPASELSAVEAAQLGSAALTLSGALGGGPGLFDKLRRGLGVDRIAFDPSVDNPASSSVTVGKYVTPKVYVSVKQDASGSAPGIAVDYEVTRRVTLSAADDGAGGESAGVKYEFDY